MNGFSDVGFGFDPRLAPRAMDSVALDREGRASSCVIVRAADMPSP